MSEILKRLDALNQTMDAVEQATPSSPGSVRAALDLLERDRSYYEKSVRDLEAQKAGVERSLAKAKAKLEAIQEAIAAIAPNAKAERP